MRRTPERAAIAALALVLLAPVRAAAYGVLAHEAMVDAAWEGELAPLLRRQFPGITNEGVRQARAYAYGGSLIQDLGYYPFGSKFFSNLVHYVRSGEFVEALIREARNANEFAFALGAIAHYASDNVGHPNGTNRVVPIVYPKLREKHGPEVLYAHSPSRHLMVEFAFDVLQVARGTFKADIYQELIGFEVAGPVLQRAFAATYGLELGEIFGDLDVAISTYRKAVSQIIPDITRRAWEDKRDEILDARPDLTERDFVFTFTREQYEERYGVNYRKPGLLSRIVVAIFKVVPKFGPFKPLAFEPLTADAERMYLESFAASGARYVALLQAVGAGSVALSDTDLDTGTAPAPGVNPLADETNQRLGETLARTGRATARAHPTR